MASSPPSTSPLSDGDVWDDDTPDHEHFQQLSNNHWTQLEKIHSNAGYKEGIVEGKDKVMQRGFNIGWRDGATIGWQIGKWLGILSTLEIASQSPQDASRAKDLKIRISQLTMQSIFTPEYLRSTNDTMSKIQDSNTDTDTQTLETVRTHDQRSPLDLGPESPILKLVGELQLDVHTLVRDLGYDPEQLGINMMG